MRLVPLSGSRLVVLTTLCALSIGGSPRCWAAEVPAPTGSAATATTAGRDSLRVSDSAIASAATRYLGERARYSGFSGAVLIARDDRVVFRESYGWADVEHRIRFTPETRQPIASVSKMFTAMAAMKLRDAGRLAFEDPICRYLDDCPAAWSTITVDQLIHHTSGISDYEERMGLGEAGYLSFMARPEATSEIFATARRDTLDFAPGTRFHYSNTGYVVLAHLIERVAGERFTDYVRRTLLEPAGMTHTGVLGVPGVPELAAGYTHGDIGWDTLLAGAPLEKRRAHRVPMLAFTPPTGDGFLYSNVDDLLHWSRTMDGGAVVSAAEVAEAFTPGIEGYGFGWNVGEAMGQRRLWHNGVLPGYLTYLIKFPNQHLTIALLCNLDRVRIEKIVRELSAIALGRPYDLPVHGTQARPSASDYAALEGVYAMTDGARLTIKKEPDLLSASLPDQFTAGLIPLSATEFYMPLSDGRVTFTRGTDGRVERVNLRYSGTDHVATRIPPSPSAPDSSRR